MSAARILKFAHRFKSGALCEIEIDLDAVRDTHSRRASGGTAGNTKPANLSVGC
jgi:hypothetical protein